MNYLFLMRFSSMFFMPALLVGVWAGPVHAEGSTKVWDKQKIEQLVQDLKTGVQNKQCQEPGTPHLHQPSLQQQSTKVWDPLLSIGAELANKAQVGYCQLLAQVAEIFENFEMLKNHVTVDHQPDLHNKTTVLTYKMNVPDELANELKTGKQLDLYEVKVAWNKKLQ